MKDLLAIDIGNTNIAVGIFEDGRLIKKGRIPTHAYFLYAKRLKKLFKTCRISTEDAQHVVISSVVPIATTRLTKMINRIMKCEITIIGKGLMVPIKNLYRKKSEVGQDRLVNAYAAKAIYGAPCVIIDFGTAITFDIVSRDGAYLGGLIIPGIELSLSSLYERTALLPRVQLKPARHIIGKDTVNSMRGGILFGFGAMCDGLIARYRSILGKDLKTIATGGNANLIRKYTNAIQIVDEDLTLKGLIQLYLAS